MVAVDPTVLEIRAKVRRTVLPTSRSPRAEMKNASLRGCGQISSRFFAYRARAARVESETGTKRDFPNFVCRIERTPFPRSTSALSNASASAGRRPVAARSPMSVAQVKARGPFNSVRRAAPAINRAISSSVKICGFGRRRRAGSSPDAGTSVRGSIVLNQAAKPRTILRRRAHVARCTSFGFIAQRRASSDVMNSAPSRFMKSTK